MVDVWESRDDYIHIYLYANDDVTYNAALSHPLTNNNIEK